MKNLCVAILSLIVSISLYGQNSTDLSADSVKVLVTLKNGDVEVGYIVDQNERQLLLQKNKTTETIAFEDVTKVDSILTVRDVKVTTKEGMEYTGTLLQETEDRIVIQSQNGLLILNMGAVKKIENDNTQLYKKITMKDGTVYIGYTEKSPGDDPVIITESGRINYNPDQVERVETIDPSRVKFFDHASATRYFFTSTAIPLRKGEGYYNNQLLLVNSFQYGVTNNISMGFGVEAISTLFLVSPTPFGNIKVGFSPAENFHISGGIVAGAAFGRIVNDRTEYLVSPFAAFTVGDRNRNFTLGAGRGFIRQDQFNYVKFSGTLRVSRRVAFISNNAVGYSVDDGEATYFGFQGIRIIGRSGDLDLALAYSDESIRTGFAIPYIGFSFKL
ncbi:MAG: hypothetical protein GVX78_05500 [Bacteroidetes bacterium]|jgi:sporulation protein YlmC with PRC-barrel domain|nr:hypothetical protein [Bacteroidota bacterium]